MSAPPSLRPETSGIFNNSLRPVETTLCQQNVWFKKSLRGENTSFNVAAKNKNIVQESPANTSNFSQSRSKHMWRRPNCLKGRLKAWFTLVARRFSPCGVCEWILNKLKCGTNIGLLLQRYRINSITSARRSHPRFSRKVWARLKKSLLCEDAPQSLLRTRTLPRNHMGI